MVIELKRSYYKAFRLQISVQHFKNDIQFDGASFGDCAQCQVYLIKEAESYRYL